MFIQKVDRDKLASASIVKVMDKENIKVHYPGIDGVTNGCCYIEIKDADINTIVLYSPCPFNVPNDTI